MFPGLVKATQLNDLLIYAEAQLAKACAERPLGLRAELRVHLLQRGWPPKDRALGFPSPPLSRMLQNSFLLCYGAVTVNSP